MAIRRRTPPLIRRCRPDLRIVRKPLLVCRTIKCQRPKVSITVTRKLVLRSDRIDTKPRRVAPAWAIVRPEPALVPRRITRTSIPAFPPNGFQTDPHVDYGRFLTPEGGILIVYKDLDTRWRHTVWRVFAWSVATGFDTSVLLYHSPVQSVWINALCLLLAAAINLFIVWKAVEIYRRIEIRPDCLILEGQEVFWLEKMEEWPSFQPDEEGNLVLRGTYGTRLVEYLTVRRFDEEDRMPEVFANHLQQAMQQLWETALATGAAPVGSHSGWAQQRR
jgi:hypothetical protein